MERIVGVESSHGFGDALFNLSLIKALSEHFSCKIGVATQPTCADAFVNIPWISEIIEIPAFWHGMKKLNELGYQRTIQITQNDKFFQFKNHDHNHSLIDTPLWTGRELGLPNFDQHPIFIPTEEEIRISNEYGQTLNGQPTIAIESIAKSGQSWADHNAIKMIIDRYINTHKILWLSNQGAPEHPNVDNLLRYSRRQIIMFLQHCETFFSVGSGFLCGILALPPKEQPKHTVCLWVDDLYKYEYKLNDLQWANIIWVHNHEELSIALN